jgi:hypothetical protein
MPRERIKGKVKRNGDLDSCWRRMVSREKGHISASLL